MNGFIRFVHRFIIKYSKDNRPSSYPYISGDSFRKLADHIYTTDNNFVSENVKYRDVVFVETDKVKFFFSEVHHKINSKYFLVTHNSDISVDSELSDLVDEKIIKWFGQNVTVNHPKIVPIPIGLENLYYYDNGIINYFNFFKNKTINKKNKILFGFSVNTNSSERIPAYDFFKNSMVSEEIDFKLNSFNYLKLLNGYKFVASPPGNGLDCHRTWEAMYLKVVPIVKRSVAMEYFFSIGLPLWIVDSWDEIKGFDEKSLENKYDDLKKRFNSRVLFMDYWVNQIKGAC